MFMKTFTIMLKNSLKKYHPGVDVEMYVSRRSKFVHMGLEFPLNKIDNSEKFVRDIDKSFGIKKKNRRYI